MLKMLEQKILEKEAKIGVIGLGYVGLPLAITFVKAGFRVYGIDVDSDRVKGVNKGISHILDVASEEVRDAVSSGAFSATTDFSNIRNLDAFIICVPTPLNKNKEPDITYMVAAAEEITKHMRRGQIIVLESTTYPGTTEEVLLPVLESSGLKEGRDFYLAFSPERVDPGNKKYKTKNTPKITGGISRSSGKMAKLLYEQAIDHVIPVSSSKVAEMVKLLENTFRIVNIALVNEMMLMCGKLGIDIWEVIEAAKTKPYGFMPFYPGPGVGGHCIPIDPIYLSWKARIHGFEARFIDLASRVNSEMPDYVVSKVSDALNGFKKSVKGSRILILGVAYKKDIKDLRESPALEIIEKLDEEGALISYHDPYFPYLKIHGINLKNSRFNKSIFKEADCVVLVTDHSGIDYKFVADNTGLIVDTRNAMRGVRGKAKVVKL